MMHEPSCTVLREGGGFADRGANESGKGAGRDGSEGVGRGLRRLASDNPADGGKQGVVRGVIESLTKVMAALEASGLEFINEGAVSGGGGRGVRLRNGSG